MAEESRKEFELKVESLESIVRMFELKAKNAQDHGELIYCRIIPQIMILGLYDI